MIGRGSTRKTARSLGRDTGAHAKTDVLVVTLLLAKPSASSAVFDRSLFPGIALPASSFLLRRANRNTIGDRRRRARSSADLRRLLLASGLRESRDCARNRSVRSRCDRFGVRNVEVEGDARGRVPRGRAPLTSHNGRVNLSLRELRLSGPASIPEVVVIASDSPCISKDVSRGRDGGQRL